MIAPGTFWAQFYATGGTYAKSDAMGQMAPDVFWKKGAWETVNPLDATEWLPRGGNKPGDNPGVVPRQ